MEREVIQRVLKRLLSNEAAPAFLCAARRSNDVSMDATMAAMRVMASRSRPAGSHPVPLSETVYYKSTPNPICLEEIMREASSEEGYSSYHAFQASLETLLSNAWAFNDEGSLEWILACSALAHGLLSEPAIPRWLYSYGA